MSTRSRPVSRRRLTALVAPLGLVALALAPACGIAGRTEAETATAASEPTADAGGAADANSTLPVATGTGGTTGEAAGGAVDLTLAGSGFTPHVGQALNAALLDPNGKALAVSAAKVDATGAFNIVFPAAVVAGQTYSVAYYADVNGNGICNEPPIDHAWTAPVPAVSGPAARVEVTHNGNFVPVCQAFGTFGLHFLGSQFDGHDGQTLYVSVADMADGSIVSSTQHMVIAGGVADLDFPTLLVPGHTYTVGFFADVDKNATCDAVDHQWLSTVAKADANATVMGMHSAPQVSACKVFPTGKLQ